METIKKTRIPFLEEKVVVKRNKVGTHQELDVHIYHDWDERPIDRHTFLVTDEKQKYCRYKRRGENTDLALRAVKRTGWWTEESVDPLYGFPYSPEEASAMLITDFTAGTGDLFPNDDLNRIVDQVCSEMVDWCEQRAQSVVSEISRSKDTFGEFTHLRYHDNGKVADMVIDEYDDRVNINIFQLVQENREHFRYDFRVEGDEAIFMESPTPNRRSPGPIMLQKLRDHGYMCENIDGESQISLGQILDQHHSWAIMLLALGKFRDMQYVTGWGRSFLGCYLANSLGYGDLIDYHNYVEDHHVTDEDIAHAAHLYPEILEWVDVEPCPIDSQIIDSQIYDAYSDFRFYDIGEEFEPEGGMFRCYTGFISGEVGDRIGQRVILAYGGSNGIVIGSSLEEDDLIMLFNNTPVGERLKGDLGVQLPASLG